jgi:outer membrane protein OmpA-like peptidoglycan-associated protein
MKNFSMMLLSLLLCVTLYAQQDADGCIDHPLFNRMPNYYIVECSKNFGLADLAMTDGNTKTIEGYKTMTSYEFNTESGQEPYSFYQVVKNYEVALKKFGVKRIYLASQYATLFFKSGDKSIWLGIESASDMAPTYTLIIMEIEEMQQDIQASAILDELNKSGHIALYINFATGKSEIKPESQPIIDQIAEMLTANPDIKVGIEGHTDNVGAPASNQTLSVNRANSVLTAVAAKGVSKTRMTAKGMGQTKPIADNATDEGKALNRRVEIVKQ